MLETTRVALREKNADELIQQTAFMIYRESQVGTDGAHRAVARAEAEAVRRAEPPTEPVTVDSDGESLATVETSPSEAAEIEDSVDVAAADQATRDGQLVSAARNIRRLVTIFFTSPELRAAINDTLLVLQEMIKDKQKEKSQGKSKEGQEADGKGKTGTTGQSRDTQPDASETTEALPTKAEENTVDAPTTDPAPDASSAGEEVTTSFDYLKGLFDDAVAAVNGDTPANGAAHTTGSTPQPPGAYWDDADDPDSEYTDAEEDPQHHEAAEELTGFLSDPRLVECGEKLKLAM